MAVLQVQLFQITDEINLSLYTFPNQSITPFPNQQGATKGYLLEPDNLTFLRFRM
jgi:hypothetical protein